MRFIGVSFEHVIDYFSLLDSREFVEKSRMFCRMFQLELEGLHLDEGTDAEADPDFLLELMEINEALADAQTPEEASQIGRDTKGKQK